MTTSKQLKTEQQTFQQKDKEKNKNKQKTNKTYSSISYIPCAQPYMLRKD